MLCKVICDMYFWVFFSLIKRSLLANNTEFISDLRKKIDEAKRSDRNFDERQILDWISQSTNALKYLHSRKPDAIIHRDIKPE